MALIAGALAGIVVIYAWVDGGEEPLRPIVQSVAVPGAAS